MDPKKKIPGFTVEVTLTPLVRVGAAPPEEMTLGDLNLVLAQLPREELDAVLTGSLSHEDCARVVAPLRLTPLATTEATSHADTEEIIRGLLAQIHRDAGRRTEMAGLRDSALAAMRTVAEIMGLVDQMTAALVWASAASDFQDDGRARVGFERLMRPLIERGKSFAASRRAPPPPPTTEEP